MGWKDIYRDASFCPYKEELAQYLDLNDAFETLKLFLNGQSNHMDVEDALSTIEYRYGTGLSFACNEFRNALKIDDEQARHVLCREALKLIERYLQRNHSGQGL